MANRNGLTKRQIGAAEAYARGATKLEAYKGFYTWANMKRETVQRRAGELFALTHVADYVQEVKEELQRTGHLTLNEVLRLMADSLKVDPLSIFDDEGAVKPMSEIPEETRLAMTAFDVTETTGGLFGDDRKITRVRFSPKSSIMDMFMKKFGDYAAKKMTLEDNRIVSKAITPEEIKEIDKYLESEY